MAEQIAKTSPDSNNGIFLTKMPQERAMRALASLLAVGLLTVIGMVIFAVVQNLEPLHFMGAVISTNPLPFGIGLGILILGGLIYTLARSKPSGHSATRPSIAARSTSSASLPPTPPTSQVTVSQDPSTRPLASSSTTLASSAQAAPSTSSASLSPTPSTSQVTVSQDPSIRPLASSSTTLASSSQAIPPTSSASSSPVTTQPKRREPPPIKHMRDFLPTDPGYKHYDQIIKNNEYLTSRPGGGIIYVYKESNTLKLMGFDASASPENAEREFQIWNKSRKLKQAAPTPSTPTSPPTPLQAPSAQVALASPLPAPTPSMSSRSSPGASSSSSSAPIPFTAAASVSAVAPSTSHLTPFSTYFLTSGLFDLPPAQKHIPAPSHILTTEEMIPILDNWSKLIGRPIATFGVKYTISNWITSGNGTLLLNHLVAYLMTLESNSSPEQFRKTLLSILPEFITVCEDNNCPDSKIIMLTSIYYSYIAPGTYRSEDYSLHNQLILYLLQERRAELDRIINEIAGKDREANVILGYIRNYFSAQFHLGDQPALYHAANPAYNPFLTKEAIFRERMVQRYTPKLLVHQLRQLMTGNVIYGRTLMGQIRDWFLYNLPDSQQELIDEGDYSDASYYQLLLRQGLISDDSNKAIHL